VGGAIEEFLERELTDDGSLAIEGTPQNRALEQLLQTNPDLDTTDPDDQIEILQRYALNTLYFSTEGANWTNSLLWTEAGHPCGSDDDPSWHGVICDDLLLVEELSLDMNDLFGQLTSEIRGLATLSKSIVKRRISRILSIALILLFVDYAGTLNLFGNMVEGIIPSEIGNMTQLALVEFGDNFMSGTLPTEIGLLEDLFGFAANLNFLSGFIPSEIGQLAALATLNVANNNIFGSIPTEIGDMAQLGEKLRRVCFASFRQ
jgi:hypothetical protein